MVIFHSYVSLPDDLLYLSFPWLARACVEKVVPRVKLYLRTSRNYKKSTEGYSEYCKPIYSNLAYLRCVGESETEEIARIIQNGMFHYALINGKKNIRVGYPPLLDTYM